VFVIHCYVPAAQGRHLVKIKAGKGTTFKPIASVSFLDSGSTISQKWQKMQRELEKFNSLYLEMRKV
jgi:hypothetical protein